MPGVSLTLFESNQGKAGIVLRLHENMSIILRENKEGELILKFTTEEAVKKKYFQQIESSFLSVSNRPFLRNHNVFIAMLD